MESATKIVDIPTPLGQTFRAVEVPHRRSVGSRDNNGGVNDCYTLHISKLKTLVMRWSWPHS